MSSVLFFLATVSPSDELNDSYLRLAVACFALTGLCALVAGGLKLFGERKYYRLGMGIAALGLVLGLIELSFAWYVRHIDFQPVEVDGTKASPSLIKALFVPFMPVLLNALLLLAHWKAGRSPATEEK